MKEHHFQTLINENVNVKIKINTQNSEVGRQANHCNKIQLDSNIYN